MDVTTFCREVGRRVRCERRAMGLTQRELARRAKVSERLVRSLENGETRSVSLDRMISVLSQLGIGLQLADTPAVPTSTQDDSYSVLLRKAVESWGGGE